MIFVLILSAVWTVAEGQEKDPILTVFWNLENFFDYQDGGTSESDGEFSPQGSRRWTAKRFYYKCDLIAKSLCWMGDRYGRLPDVIGLAEIENMTVLKRLLSSTVLRKYDYRIIHRDSPDRRGIDVALLYRKSIFDLIDTSFITPSFNEEEMATRDILHARLQHTSDGVIYDFIVNHHPSKFGGSKESMDRRSAAMQTLCSICDSLIVKLTESYGGMISMGDFNDTPDGSQFSLLKERLINTCDDLFRKGEGTIRFEGKWDLIDMFWVSEAIYDGSDTEILRIPFLMTRERKHPGEKPLRTYSGPRYLGGVSDHCPIILLFNQ